MIAKQEFFMTSSVTSHVKKDYMLNYQNCVSVFKKCHYNVFSGVPNPRIFQNLLIDFIESQNSNRKKIFV